MNNHLRVTGLASPFDTEQMIDDLMKVERMKVDKVEQEKQVLVWRREAYNDLNKDFANFILNTKKEFGLTKTTSTGTMVSNSYKSLSWLKKATSSNERVATVSTTSKAMEGNYNVKVDRLAEGVKLVSSSNISKGNKANLASQFELEGDTIEFSIQTKQTMEMKDVGTTSVIGSTENIQISMNKDGSVNFKITNLDNTSMEDVVKAINSAKIEYKMGEGKNKTTKQKSLGLRAAYDSNIDRFFLQTEDIGKDAKLNISIDKATEEGNDAESFLEALALNVTHSVKETDNAAESEIVRKTEKFVIGAKYSGQDAKLNFDGAEGIEVNSNQFTINGIDFALKTTGEITTTVSTDVDVVYEKIQKFVNEYNKLIEKSGELLTQKKYRDYQPLTEEQKKAMEEKDIELWEEKAKSGLLRNDDIISRIMRSSRNLMYDKVEGVEGKFSRLFEIGIDTEGYFQGSLGGKLVIDEVKLKNAIRDDSNGVLELLFKEPDYGKLGIESNKQERELTREELKAKRSHSGLITRLYDNLIVGMQDIISKSGTGKDSNLYRDVKSNMLIDFVTKHGSISSIDKDVMQLDNRIDDLNAYLFKKENHYYAKFTAMEKALSRMNQQSMWIMQQFSS